MAIDPEVAVGTALAVWCLIPVAQFIFLGVVAKRLFLRLAAIEERMAALEGASLAARDDIG